MLESKRAWDCVCAVYGMYGTVYTVIYTGIYTYILWGRRGEKHACHKKPPYSGAQRGTPFS